MLPPKVHHNSQRAIQLVMDERSADLARKIGEINADYSSRGLGTSGVRIGAIRDAIAPEAVSAADTIWRCIREVYESTGCSADESHRAELKGLFDEAFRRPENVFPSMLEQQARLAPLPERLSTHRFGDELRPIFSHLRNKQHFAIDLYIDGRLSAPPPTSATVTNTFNVNAPIGIMQTGRGSVANISGGLSQNEQSAALEALAQAITAIIKAPAGTVDTARLLGIAAEASETVKAPNPDRSKLRQAFDILSSGVQAIGSAPQAHAAMQAALAIFT